MIRFLFTRLILPLLIFWLVRSIFKSIGESLKTTASRPQQQPPPYNAGGELKKDPVCGTYVSPGAAVTATVKGELLYFCSAACRDRYKA